MQTSTQLRQHRRRLKRQYTKSEELFAHRLDECGIKYKPQMIFGFYILDFCIPDRMLNIEIDGSFHDKRSAYDSRRDAFVMRSGFMIIRIPNSLVPHFNMAPIIQTPIKSLKEFRSALAKANSLRSIAIYNQKNVH